MGYPEALVASTSDYNPSTSGYNPSMDDYNQQPVQKALSVPPTLPLFLLVPPNEPSTRSSNLSPEQLERVTKLL